MRETQVEQMLPLYEAKMIHHYDHRWATYESDGSVRDVTLAEKQDLEFVVLPRYWVRESVVDDALGEAECAELMLGVRDVCRSTDERTAIASMFPRAAVGNNLPIIRNATQPERLVAVLSSFALDFVARLKVGGTHLNFFIANQLPVLSPAIFEEQCGWSGETVGDWLDRRVSLLGLESWRSNLRGRIRAEIDAAMFHLYGIERGDVDYIMETFPIVKRKDVALHGEFRTKRLILEAYDAMAAAISGGPAYLSPLEEQRER